MPGDKVETDFVGSGAFKKRFDPVGVISSNGRAADFILGRAGAIHNSPGGLSVEGGIRWFFAVMPAAKEIGFVPNFVINATDIFVNGITTGGGFDKRVPFIPIPRRGGVFIASSHFGRSVGEREHGAGAGSQDRVDHAIKSAKIVVTRPLIDVVVVK